MTDEITKLRDEIAQLKSDNALLEASACIWQEAAWNMRVQAENNSQGFGRAGWHAAIDRIDELSKDSGPHQHAFVKENKREEMEDRLAEARRLLARIVNIEDMGINWMIRASHISDECKTIRAFLAADQKGGEAKPSASDCIRWLGYNGALGVTIQWGDEDRWYVHTERQTYSADDGSLVGAIWLAMEDDQKGASHE